MKAEDLFCENSLNKLNFDNFNKKIFMNKSVDDNIDWFFDQIDNLINEWVKIKYLQQAKKISNKKISAKF